MSDIIFLIIGLFALILNTDANNNRPHLVERRTVNVNYMILERSGLSKGELNENIDDPLFTQKIK